MGKSEAVSSWLDSEGRTYWSPKSLRRSVFPHALRRFPADRGTLPDLICGRSKIPMPDSSPLPAPHAEVIPAWLQAHGHAQIVGWIGTFSLGIGFYSLSKMGKLPLFAVSRGWTCFSLWTTGVTLRWIAGVVEWHWRILLPLSALLELAGFLLFFYTVAGHRAGAGEPRRKRETWMLMVLASVFGFLTS